MLPFSRSGKGIKRNKKKEKRPKDQKRKRTKKVNEKDKNQRRKKISEKRKRGKRQKKEKLDIYIIERYRIRETCLKGI